MRDLKFWLNGKCNADYGIVLQKEITFSGAEPDYTFQHISGRNGDIAFWDASYKNVTASVSCYVTGVRTADLFRQRAVEFFFSTPGYLRLETDNEPDVFRLVVPTTGPETDIRLRNMAPFSVQLSAKPQIFLKSGESALQISQSGASIMNPTGFSALPLITVYGNSAGSLFVGGTECRFLSLNEYCTVDCDTQSAFKGDESKDSTVAIAEFPVLSAGETAITWTGGIQSVEIIPRWCRIQ